MSNFRHSHWLLHHLVVVKIVDARYLSYSDFALAANCFLKETWRERLNSAPSLKLKNYKEFQFYLKLVFMKSLENPTVEYPKNNQKDSKKKDFFRT